MMKKFTFLLSLMIAGIYCKAQEVQTLWVDHLQNPTTEARATWKKVLTVNDSVLTIRLTSLKTKDELVEHYKNGRPVGIWQEIYKRKVRKERNFDSIIYEPDLFKFANSGIVFPDENGKDVDPALQVSPLFPGGDVARIKFLQNNIVYPKVARENGYQGTTYLALIIDRDGNVENVSVIKSSNPYLDYEAVRVTKMLPKWSPGKVAGNPVRVLFNMPLKFTLAG